ncbi:MAG: arylsulfatase [Desulfobacterales bacterium]|nr:arylsulfatase [Desulfobacterales bacterium]MBF0395656.1 arylsulfatase [Desulfobacterales bacterium]
MYVKKLLNVHLWAWIFFTIFTLALGCGGKNMNAPVSSEDRTPKKKPNFITLVMDDMGWSDCGFMGSEIPTPNIDNLANNSTVFTNFYAASTSSPSRSQLFTGKDCHQVGAGTMCGYILPQLKGKPGYECTLQFYAPTFAEVLQDEGYHTMFTGKWHLGMKDELLPNARGFKDARGVILEGVANFFANDDGSIIPEMPPAAYKRYNRKTFWNENGKELTHFPKDFYATNYLTDKAIDMLKVKPKNKPFYLNISYNAVHFPLQAPEEVTKKYMSTYSKGWDIIRKERFERQKALGYFSSDAVLPKRDDVPAWDSLSEKEKQIETKKMAIYAAMLDIVDQNIGILIKHLKESGEYENTVIIFLSDNGASSRDPSVDKAYHMVDWIKKNFDNSYESLGTKRSYFGITKGWAMAANTPFNRFKATMYEGGVHTSAFVHYPKAKKSYKKYDCVTSIMDIAPTILELADISYPKEYKGKSLSPMQGVSFAGLIQDKSFKSVCDKNRYLGWEFVGIKGLRYGDLKLSQEGGDNEFHFFNLSEDPFETDELSKKLPEKFEELKKVYKKYQEENGVVDIPNKIGAGG